MIRPTTVTFWVVGVLLAAGAAQAQTNVRLEVGRRLVGLGETVEVTVTISVDGRAGYDEYFPPVMNGFRVGGSAMTSQNVEVINWRVRRRETYIYHAIPTRTGRLTIGPAAIRIGGRTIKSSRVKLEVKRGVPGRQPAVPPGSAPPGTTPPASDVPGQVPVVPRDRGFPRGRRLPSVFIAAAAEPMKVYVGQQIVAVWRLYTQSDVLGYQPQGQPSTDQFWIEDLDAPKRLRFEREVIENRVFFNAVVWRKALFPQRAGKLVIGALTANVRTLERFGRRPQAQSSEPLEIEVLPLPKQGKPDQFPPQNVGQFEIAALVDRERVKAGEAVQLKVVVRGSGNLPQLKVGQLKAGSGFKLYDPKVSEQLDRAAGIAGEKTIEYLLLPKRGGKLDIPPVHLDYFDPSTGKYHRASTKAIALTVTGKLPTGRTGGATGDGRKNVLGRDIRPPRSPGSLSHQPRFNFFGGWSLWALVLPLALFLGVTGAGSLRARLSRQTARTLSRAAARRVRQQLRRASEAAQRGDAAACYSNLAAALCEQLGERLGVRVEGLTRPELSQAMIERGYANETISETIEQLDSADFGRFAGSGIAGDELQKMTQRVRRLIGRLTSERLASNGRSSEEEGA